MPLTRGNVTPGLRLLLPALPTFAGILGASMVLTPDARLVATPVFEVAERWAPLAFWGAGFALVAGTLTVALLAHHRATYVLGLALLVFWLAVWAVVAFGSAVVGDSSWSAWAWPAFAGAVGFAVMLDLNAHSR